MSEKDTDAASDLGVTIKAETNAKLDQIKAKTGLSKSMVANLGLAYLAPRILRGELVIVNGKIEQREQLAA